MYGGGEGSSKRPPVSRSSAPRSRARSASTAGAARGVSSSRSLRTLGGVTLASPPSARRDLQSPETGAARLGALGDLANPPAVLTGGERGRQGQRRVGRRVAPDHAAVSALDLEHVGGRIRNRMPTELEDAGLARTGRRRRQGDVPALPARGLAAATKLGADEQSRSHRSHERRGQRKRRAAPPGTARRAAAGVG